MRAIDPGGPSLSFGGAHVEAPSNRIWHASGILTLCSPFPSSTRLIMPVTISLRTTTYPVSKDSHIGVYGTYLL